MTRDPRYLTLAAMIASAFLVCVALWFVWVSVALLVTR